jgi:hypothetical protein
MDLKAFALAATVMLPFGSACGARPPAASQLPSSTLSARDGSSVDVRQLVATAPLTVLVFFSPGCHCLDLHEARIRELYAQYHPRGVQFVMVDSEVRASAESDLAEATRRSYPFPILIDRGARLADALGAEYATYSVVIDAQGRVRYRGGFDSDKMHLLESATPYVRDALDDLLAGRSPRVAEAKALGCALEKW